MPVAKLRKPQSIVDCVTPWMPSSAAACPSANGSSRRPVHSDDPLAS